MTGVNEGSKFANQRVNIDDDMFKDCTFTECTIIYSGGLVRMEGCTFDTCRWELAGSALNTLNFFGLLYHGLDMKDFMEATFQSVRDQKPPGRPKSH